LRPQFQISKPTIKTNNLMTESKLQRDLNLRRALWALASGTLFAFGLVLGGMTQPPKVLAFLDVAGIAKGISNTAEPGLWDPSLAFVMGGALCVSFLAFWLTPKRGKPLLDAHFHLPQKQNVDKRLLLGATLFGVGWGLAGYCPGPALASILTGGQDALTFVAALVVGMWAAKRIA
jgi:uncharacterized protein